MIKKTIFTLIITALIVFVSCKEKATKTSSNKDLKIENKILKDDKSVKSIDNEADIDSVFKIDKYICYTLNNDKSKRIWIGFSKKNKEITSNIKLKRRYISFIFEIRCHSQHKIKMNLLC